MSEIDFRALQDFFAADEIEWRLQQAGEKNGKLWAIAVPYVTNRAIQQRLDDVCGPGRWRNEFRAGPGGGVLCGISVKVDGEWVTKWDGAENTDIEEVKGGLSGAMKRAAVQWGIGRFLYKLDETFANVHEGGKLRGKTKDGKPFKWDPPALPAWARASAAAPGGAEGNRSRSGSRGTSGASSSNGGKATRSDHEALLEFVKATGPRVGDGEVGEVDGLEVDLKTFIRTRWTDIKEHLPLAQSVVEALEKATGVHFARAAA